MGRSAYLFSPKGMSLLKTGRLAFVLGGALLAVQACATTSITADLRPAYEAAREAALEDMLDCASVNQAVCECRSEGLAQEFANPSIERFDSGYAVLVAYREDPANEGHTFEQAEDHAVRSIYTAIKADVENICSYYENEGAH